MAFSSLCYPNFSFNSSSSVKHILTVINYKQPPLLIHLSGAME